MGLMGTLAKVAIGYAAARGVDRMSGGQGLGALLGGGAQVEAKDPTAKAQAQVARSMSPGGGASAGAMAGNPMQDMMEQLSKGGLGGLMGSDSPLGKMMAQMQGAGGGSMSDIMEKMKSSGLDLSQIMGSGPGGEKGGLLSQLGAGGTGLAGLLASMGGTTASAQGQGASTVIEAFEKSAPQPEAEAAAALMLRAMIQAAKADGGIDASEKAKILETLGDADAEDMEFVNRQLKAEVDPEALAADTPEAQRMQVYSASLMTIRVDTEAEAQYLDRLARAMQLPEPVVNMLHMQMGLQPLYA